MKKIAFTVCLSIASLALFAQIKEGRVIYERTAQIRMQFANPNRDNTELEKLFPKQQVTTFELLFGNNQSLWQSLPDANNEANQMSASDGNGRAFVINRIGGNDDVVYNNLNNGKKISSRETSSQRFIVEDTFSKNAWKITDETKAILNFKATKAVAQIYSKRLVTNMENGEIKRKEMPDTLHVTAWFTTDVPVPTGPDYHGQLPGLVLEININNGQTVYKALEFSSKVNLAQIKEPKGGKRVTAAEYRSELEKIMEETRRRFAENGGRITISQ